MSKPEQLECECGTMTLEKCPGCGGPLCTTCVAEFEECSDCAEEEMGDDVEEGETDDTDDDEEDDDGP